VERIRHKISGIILVVIKKEKKYWLCSRYNKQIKIKVRDLEWYESLVDVINKEGR